MKRLLCCFMTFVLVSMVMVCPVRTKAASVYWYSGLTKIGGGNARAYYKGNYLYLKGKFGKGSTEDKAYSAKKVYISKKFKLKKNCKVIECEGLEEKAYPLKSRFKPGEKFSTFFIDVKIKGSTVYEVVIGQN